MRRMKAKHRLLRLIFCILLMAMMCSGCASPKYEAVDVTSLEESSTDGESTGSETKAEESKPKMTLSIGKTENAEENLSIGADGETEQENPDAEGADSSEEAEPKDPFTPADEMIVVTADVLNVRESDSEDSRIYVQLKTGDTLHRTGWTEKWSRVIYDGKTAYVASEMVEVKKEETLAETESQAASDGEGAEELWEKQLPEVLLLPLL